MNPFARPSSWGTKRLELHTQAHPCLPVFPISLLVKIRTSWESSVTIRTLNDMTEMKGAKGFSGGINCNHFSPLSMHTHTTEERNQPSVLAYPWLPEIG